MAKKALVAAAAIAIAVLVTGAMLYSRNATPVVPPISTATAATPGTPWVIKLHAQWCPVCMLTKTMWTQIAQTYAGRVRLVVFDFTSDATTAASRAEAERLGLERVFAEAGFATGPIVVLDGDSKDIVAWINGSRDFSDYRAAIDAALPATEP